jgi:hypothetical protein
MFPNPDYDYRSPRHRALIRAGQAKARAKGKHIGHPLIHPLKEAAIRKSLKVPGRLGMIKLAKAHGVGCGTIQRIARELRCEGLLAPIHSMQET